MALTDEQYQQFLEIYDDTFQGLQLNGRGNYDVIDSRVSVYRETYEEAERMGTAEILRSVWKNDDGSLEVNGDSPWEDIQHYCEEAGIDSELLGQCQERLNLANR